METGVHIAILSNIILEPHFVPMVKQYLGENTVVFPIPVGEYTDSEYTKKLASADMVVVWINLESLFPELFYGEAEQSLEEVVEFCKKVYVDLISVSYTKILWFSFEDYMKSSFVAVGHIYHNFVDKLNLILSDTFHDQVSFINLKHLIAEVGISNAYDSRGKYRWNAPYSKILIEAVATEIQKQYLIEKGITKKCLVLDCDNVLWGGILSEDGIENIKLSGSGLGRKYQDFQRLVLSLYYHGAILAVCSKNDLSDVMTMFREHSEMILKEEHIACFQVNWNSKTDNIMKIADALNIGLDSMVFIDDTDFEIEAIKQLLPDVTAVKYESDIIYSRLTCFNLKNDVNIEKIRERNNTYKTNKQRVELRDSSESFEDYLHALDMKVDIHPAVPIEYARISELTQRTNKCTNGKRYAVTEIKKHVVSDSVNLYSVYISDRFSDLGLVGAIEVDSGALTLFSLSCRALGREIERKMTEAILDKHKVEKIEFKPTGKNEGIKFFLAEAFPRASFTTFENI